MGEGTVWEMAPDNFYTIGFHASVVTAILVQLIIFMGSRLLPPPPISALCKGERGPCSIIISDSLLIQTTIQSNGIICMQSSNLSLNRYIPLLKNLWLIFINENKKSMAFLWELRELMILQVLFREGIFLLPFRIITDWFKVLNICCVTNAIKS